MPKLVTWNDRLSVAIYSMDSQNKQLVDMLNKLNMAMSEVMSRNRLEDILNRLIHYITAHLHYEETLMLVHNYPEYYKHKQKHYEFLLELHELRRKYEPDHKSMACYIITFVNFWLPMHIQTEDMNLGEFLRSQCIV